MHYVARGKNMHHRRLTVPRSEGRAHWHLAVRALVTQATTVAEANGVMTIIDVVVTGKAVKTTSRGGNGGRVS